MNFRMNLFVISGLLLSVIATANQPDAQLTPGLICTSQDADFKGMEYTANIAICNRNVSDAEKNQISQEYNVSQSSWRNVEFDHLIPLCAGGANDIRNVWPEALDHAHLKDRVEDQVCLGLRNGTMTQDQAVATIFDWLKAHP